jgi:hypothetical protein
VRSETAAGASADGLSERVMWDALDEGSDPTRDPGQDHADGAGEDPAEDATGGPADPDSKGR